MLVVTSAHAREGYSSHFVMLSSFCLSLFCPVILSFSTGFRQRLIFILLKSVSLILFFRFSALGRRQREKVSSQNVAHKATPNLTDHVS